MNNLRYLFRCGTSADPFHRHLARSLLWNLIWFQARRWQGRLTGLARRLGLFLSDRGGKKGDEADALLPVPDHYAALSSLTGSISTEIKWTAQNNLTGSAYNPLTNAGTLRKAYSLGTSVANSTSGGADQIFSFQQSIAGSAPATAATIDLTAMTNVLQNASVSIVRIKGYQIRLLDAVDDTTINTPVSTSVIVTNDVTLPAKLNFGSQGSGLTIDITVTAGAISAVVIGAAGTGYRQSAVFTVTVNQSGGSGGVIYVTTNSSGVPTAVAIATGGAGYATATGLATTELGIYSILSGGTQMYFDVSAGGFQQSLGSTKKNIKVINNHASNTATIEVSVFAGTS